jgi:hypothetical protein
MKIVDERTGAQPDLDHVIRSSIDSGQLCYDRFSLYFDLSQKLCEKLQLMSDRQDKKISCPVSLSL